MLKGSSCLTDQEIAALARNQVATAQLAPFLDHLAGCRECELRLNLEENSGAAGQDAQTAAPLPWTPPRIIDNYRIKEKLGEGIMGQVYLAVDTLAGREVAIKFLNDKGMDETRKQYLNEVKALGSMNHENVVTMFHYGERDGHYYLVSERVKGLSLDRLQLPLDWWEVLNIGVDAARGLAAAHRNNVLHRDVKPANLMRTESGKVKLLDFGLAKKVSQPRGAAAGPAAPPSPGVNREDLLVGTPLYMARELWQEEVPTQRSDVYALGAVLYELCTGRPPYPATTMKELINAVRRHPVEPLLARAPRVPSSLAALIDRCLHVDPLQRPADGIELALLLEQVKQRLLLEQEQEQQRLQQEQERRRAELEQERLQQEQERRRAELEQERLRMEQERLRMEQEQQRAAAWRRMVFAVVLLALAVCGAALVLPLRPRPIPPPPPPPAPTLTPPERARLIRLDGGRATLGSTGDETQALLARCNSEPPGRCDPELFKVESPDHSVTLTPFEIADREQSVDEFAEWLNREIKRDRVRVRLRRTEHDPSVDSYLYVGELPVVTLYPSTKLHSGFPLYQPQGEERIEVKEGSERQPVNQVTWYGAQLFCQNRGLRLPTEAEWEFAARGSQQRRFPWGDDEAECDQVQWARAVARRFPGCGDDRVLFGRRTLTLTQLRELRSSIAAMDAEFTVPYKPCAQPARDFPGLPCSHLGFRLQPVDTRNRDITKEGVRHLAGNVSEWVIDAFAPYPPCREQPCVDPVVIGKVLEADAPRVFRGGDVGNRPHMARGAARQSYRPDGGPLRVGFRCAAKVERQRDPLLRLLDPSQPLKSSAP